MGTIFISYRRADTLGEAGRLYDRLSAHFGQDRVFRDVDTIRPGGHFPREIEGRLAGCDAMVVLIGPDWAGEDEAGRPRLHDPGDYVRMEVAAALRAGVPVVPVLLRNAAMPPAADLPPDVEGLAHRQAMEIDGADFHDDVTGLIRILERSAGRPRSLRGLLGRRGALAGAVVAAVAATALLLPGRHRPVELRVEPATLTVDDVRALIVERGFYSAASNPRAEGIAGPYAPEIAGSVALVVDEGTGLVWERSGSRRIVQGGRDGALAWVRALNERRHGGADDWRLPTLEEALSLMRPEPHGGIHLDPLFDAAGAPFVWTADVEPGGDGWVVYYADGYTVPEDPAVNAFVRAVRSRPGG
ncbi:MAG: TIR domain-containing protein [Gemmatimonadetes bacterium]|nr:TIR domain-containing protein [Gemmatimonadota bacterium]